MINEPTMDQAFREYLVKVVDNHALAHKIQASTRW